VRHSDESPARYLAIYAQVVGQSHPSLEKARLALRDGLEAAQFEQKRSKINRRLATALSLAAAPYKICTQGERPTTRYGIALAAERISFA
jgi:hypothetical protein